MLQKILLENNVVHLELLLNVKEKVYQKKTCRFYGEAIVTTSRHGCKWKVVSKNKRIKRCCKHYRQCSGSKCHKSKKCHTVKEIRTKAFRKCHWKRFGGFSKRRRCCTWNKRCINKKCMSTKRVCSFVGKIISKKLKKGCVWRKHGKHGKRRYCCKEKRVCYGAKCHNKWRKCKYVGKIIKVFKKNIHVLYIHMEINQVEENYVVNGKIIVPE